MRCRVGRYMTFVVVVVYLKVIQDQHPLKAISMGYNETPCIHVELKMSSSETIRHITRNVIIAALRAHNFDISNG